MTSAPASGTQILGRGRPDDLGGIQLGAADDAHVLRSFRHVAGVEGQLVGRHDHQPGANAPGDFRPDSAKNRAMSSMVTVVSSP